MTLLGKTARCLTEVTFESLPEEATSVVVRSLIDTIGVTLLGSHEKASRILQETYRGCPGDSVVIGAGFRTNSEFAALINGVSSHLHDLDDTGASTQGHPSVSVLPALWALTAKRPCSGRRFITAYTVGVELFSRLSRSMPMLHLKGWHPTAVLGTMASAASCGIVLGLDEKAMSHALSIAASMSSGLVGNFGTMTKPLHVGHSSRNGLIAAELANTGFEGSGRIFDGDDNFFKSFFWGEPQAFEKQLYQWGDPYALLSPGIGYKLYPCCAMSHRSIDVILSLIEENDIQPKDVKSITCHGTPRARRILFYDRPSIGLEGKFCIPFLLACAVQYRRVTTDLFTDEIVSSDGIRDMMDRIIFSVHDDWVDGRDDWREDVVTIVLLNGAEISGQAEYPRGHAELPFSLDTLYRKYCSCAAGVLSDGMIEESLKHMENLEELDDVNDILSIVIGITA